MTSNDTVEARPLFVEFVGLQGAGKTTLAREVTARLAARGYRVVHQGKMGVKVVGGPPREAVRVPGWASHGPLSRFRVYLSLHYTLRAVVTSLYGYVIFSRRPSSVSMRAVRSLILLLKRLSNAIRLVGAGEADVILYGQGAVNYLRAVVASESEADPKKLRRVLRPLTEHMRRVRWVLVVCDIDVDTAVSRIGSRPKALGRFDRMDSDDARNALSFEGQFTDQVIDALVSEKALESIFRVNTVEAVDGNARLVEEMIVDALRAAPQSSAAGGLV